MSEIGVNERNQRINQWMKTKSVTFSGASNVDSISDLFDNYLDEFVTVEIQDYSGGPEGYNFDVGERKEFDLRFINNGPIGLLNVIAEVKANDPIRGLLSQSHLGGWIDPWLPVIQVRPFNLAPGENYLHQHEMSGGHLFAFQANDVTGGTDNNRDVEVLLSARILSYELDLSSLRVYTYKETAPKGHWESFIQRS